ncbi:MAG: hypothetical protein QOI54_757 [Actinomycetota bacterium]|jgi:hypothetical protein|nr:hypothetical protein [Actinomycetota bacterium]
MRRIAMLLAGAAVAALVVGGSTPALAQVPQHQVTLRGSAEVPGPGDPDGRGQFTWSLDGNRLCYLLSVKKFKTAAAAHIHRGNSKTAGPVVVPLVAPTPASAACVALRAGLAKALRDHPRRFYVNVHNVQFPNGGLRAQL